MRSNREWKRVTGVIYILLLAAVISCGFSKNVMAKPKPVKPPENVSVWMKSATSLKIKWNKSENADGYIIYKYNKKAKKYVRVHTAKKNQRSWVDKNLKTGKVYQYKVASYKLVKGKKKQSRKSYAVSAKTYGKKAKVVNAETINFGVMDGDEVGICSTLRMSGHIIGDSSVKALNTKIITEQLIWSSSDETIAQVDKNGVVTTKEKEGTCYITARAHNGVKGKVKINVINYARPKSFPYYDGGYKYVDIMLTDYRENVFNIATYFTVNKNEDVWGTIKMDEEGNITGYPGFDNIAEIEEDVRTILANFPLVTEIFYSSERVEFLMKFDKYGNSYCRIDYRIDDDMSDASGRLAPHWAYTQFSPM